MEQRVDKGSGKCCLPPVGLRIVKSMFAVFGCYIIHFIRGNDGIVFYSLLAALWCIQVYVADSKANARQRFIGTCVGAVYGLIYLLLREKLGMTLSRYEILDAVLLSLMTGIILYTTVLMQKKKASYFSCVVFFSIVVNHVADANPYLFVWNRFLDTVIGIVIGVWVNTLHLPRKKRRDILFVSGLDDTLINKKDLMSDYSRIELNRMLDEGVKFTISTVRTPGSMIDVVRNIHLKLPVIAMDGAVLYDIYEKTYLKIYIISKEESKEIYNLVHKEGLTCFTNVIKDDILSIYYEKSGEQVHEQLVKQLRRSPYRNYIQAPLPENEEAVYFMLLYPAEVIERFYKKMESEGITKKLKVKKYPSDDYPGYSYIKIYNRNAKKENMIEYLKSQLRIEKVVTFVSIPEHYDIVVNDGNMNKVVKCLKKGYEPVSFQILNKWKYHEQQ